MKKFNKLLGSLLAALLCCSVFATTACSVPRGRSYGSEEAGPAVSAGTGTPVDAQTTTEDEPTTPTTPASDDLSAYLYVGFRDAEANALDEQVYFAVSEDTLNWKTLNGGDPTLLSYKFEKGTRDPHIIRAHKADPSTPDKFYLIATDLSIYHIGGNWGASQSAGSTHIVVWESTDLVHWSEPWYSKISEDHMTCTWAPESIWDPEKEMYMVFWSSKSYHDWTLRVYRSYTSDFKTFTEPEVYIDGGLDVKTDKYGYKFIDTTFVENNGWYYRITKNENTAKVIMEKSRSLSGPFYSIDTFTLDGIPAKDYAKAFEGATIFKKNGEKKWVLMLDNFGGEGYVPYETDDLDKGRFVKMKAKQDGTYRHGVVLPITTKEYNDLKTAYAAPSAVTPDEQKMVLSLDFEDEDAVLKTGAGQTVGSVTYHSAADETKTTPTVTDGRYSTTAKPTKAITLSKDSRDYLTITGKVDTGMADLATNNPIAGLGEMTFSMTAKIPSGTQWGWFATPFDYAVAEKSGGNYMRYVGLLCNNTYTAERFANSRVSGNNLASVNRTVNTWQNVTVTYSKNSTVIYVDGVQKATQTQNIGNLVSILGKAPVLHIGKANWDTGEYSDITIDDFRIYNYALTAEQVKTEYEALGGTTEEPPEEPDPAMVFSVDFENGLTLGSGSKGTLTAEGVTIGTEAGKGRYKDRKAAILSDKHFLIIKGDKDNNPLAGTSNITISLTVKMIGDNAKPWMVYAAPDEVLHQWGTDTWETRTHLSAQWNKTQFDNARMYNNGGQDDNFASTTYGEWKHIVLVYESKKTTLYIDKEKIGENAIAADNPGSSIRNILGETPVLQFGKGNYKDNDNPDGEFANMLVDDIKVYNYALDQAGVDTDFASVEGEPWPAVEDEPLDTANGEIFRLSFEKENTEVVTGSKGTVTPTGEITYTEGSTTGSKAAVFGDNKFISVTGEGDDNPLKGLTSMTFSALVKMGQHGNNWIFYAAPNTDLHTWNTDSWKTRTLVSSQWKNPQSLLSSRLYNNGGAELNKDGVSTGAWRRLTYVYTPETTKIYVDGGLYASQVLTDEEKTGASLTTILGETPILQIGKANYGTGEYSAMVLDEFSVYNRALTDAEIRAKYGANETGELIFAAEFEDNLQTTGKGTLGDNGNTFTYEAGRKSGTRAVRINESKFLSITGEGDNNPLKGLDSFTLVMTVNAATTMNSWVYWATQTDKLTTDGGGQYYVAGMWKTNGDFACERFKGGRYYPDAYCKTPQNNWKTFTVVYRTGCTTIYVDGVFAGEAYSPFALKDILGDNPVIQLGKANWGSGEYADMLLDNFRIYNYAMNDAQAKADYDAYGFAA